MAAWLLGALLATGSAGNASAAEPKWRDWLVHDWHEVEVVVFLHSSVQTVEEITRFDPRRYPMPLTSFDPPPSAWHAPPGEETEAPDEAGDPAPYDGPVPPAWLWMDPPSSVPIPEPADAAPAASTPAEGAGDVPAPLPPPPPPDPATIAREAFAAYEEALERSSMQWRADGLFLTPHVRRMRRSADYEVLHHGRWLQAAERPARAIPVLVRLGPASAGGVHRIEGTLRVARGLFVEVDAELWVREDATGSVAPGVDSPGVEVPGVDSPGAAAERRRGYAVLSETRRMRTGDVHYLDHPRIGVVLRATRLRVPAALAELAERAEKGF